MNIDLQNSPSKEDWRYLFDLKKKISQGYIPSPEELHNINPWILPLLEDPHKWKTVKSEYFIIASNDIPIDEIQPCAGYIKYPTYETAKEALDDEPDCKATYAIYQHLTFTDNTSSLAKWGNS